MIKNFIKKLVLPAIMAFAAAGAMAQDFSFAYMTDVHISVGSQTVEDARKCMADINRQKGLSFAIFAGDITEFGSDEEIKLAKEIFDELTIPYYIVAGNHDANGPRAAATPSLRCSGMRCSILRRTVSAL